jgi:ribonuclease HI
MIEIYTDGSCIVKSCSGGWAFVNITRDYAVCGGESDTTNNRMELKAVIVALQFMKGDKDTECRITTDSKLVLNCAQKNWKRNANLDMWIEYDKESVGINITWEWVKGHSGDYYNDLVDKLANEEAKKEEKNYLV